MLRDRLHGGIGRRHPDLPADGARRPNQVLGAGGDGLRHLSGRLRLRERGRVAARDRQRRVRRDVRPASLVPRRCHRRLDEDDDGSRLPRDPRRVLAGRLDRPRRRAGLRLPAQLQPDEPQCRLRGHGPMAAGHRRPRPDPGRQAAAREARGPPDVRPRASGSLESQEPVRTRIRADRDSEEATRRPRTFDWPRAMACRAGRPVGGCSRRA